MAGGVIGLEIKLGLFPGCPVTPPVVDTNCATKTANGLMQELTVVGFLNFRRARLTLVISLVAWTVCQVAIAQTPNGRGAEQPRPSSLGTPGQKRIFALVIGIDNYKRLPTLDGAVADARDIEQALRRGGVADITLLIDSAATRAAVSAAMLRFIRETRPGDLVLISFAGHGSQEPARVKTAENNGLEETFHARRFRRGRARRRGSVCSIGKSSNGSTSSMPGSVGRLSGGFLSWRRIVEDGRSQNRAIELSGRASRQFESRGGAAGDILHRG